MQNVLPVDPKDPEPNVIARAAGVLRAGGLVVFPTETVYGLGAHALDPAAVDRIFAAKGRPAHNPVIVHVAAADKAVQVVASWPEIAAQLAERFWPGPLTLVLPRRAEVPDVVTAGGPTVAVRVPSHPVALALLRAAGVPVAAPSANPSGELSPTRAEHVNRDLALCVDAILDAGPTSGGIESTVLDLTASPPRLLRPGLIGIAELEAVVGPLSLQAIPLGEVLPAPGLLARHYSPKTPLECIEGDAQERVSQLVAEGKRVGWLAFGASKAAPTGAMRVVMPADPAEYAAQLYALLHQLDSAGLDRIVAALPPDSEEWLAIRDRLRRAKSL